VKTAIALQHFRQRLQNAAARVRPRFLPRARVPEVIRVEPPAAGTLQAFSTFSKWASIIAMAVGYHVLIGWLFGIQILKSPWPFYPEMKINSALCSILAGMCLYCLRRGPAGGGRRIVITAASALIVAVACLTLMEYLFNVRLGLDDWFPARDIVDPSTPAPGRMTLITALCFLMVGLSLLFLDTSHGHRSSEALALIAGAISLLAIASYLYAAHSFQGQMPLYTAVTVFLFSAGLLCARADHGLMAKVTSNSFGGIMARRLLPATLLIPLVLGWLQSRGQAAGLFSSEPGLALFVLANVLLFLLVVWWGVNSLHRMDTKRRDAELSLRETAAKLARSNADLEQFAYVASHDLKEPLRAISGSVQILQERYKGKLDAEAEEVIRYTVDGAARMQTLIDDLLAYSRLTTREAPMAPTDLNDIVAEVLANLERSIHESKAQVTQDPLPVVATDRTQLMQVFQNLISNAIKYRSQRTPKIHIGADDKGNEWVFSVRDNGIGIAPQYAERIFRIFQRLHTRTEYSGTGIGLAVCKKIIERHGGRIWVESEPEEGSTFLFTLPKS
jgi:signal transduction histidine kinase